MEHSSVVQSQYLQNRLRDQKAQTTGPSKADLQDRCRVRSGKDDSMFDAEAESPLKKRPSEKRYGSSPGPPTSYRHDSRPQSRRTSGTTASGQVRVVGARELEEHVDKLSKQNFDLKLEVYHRREKIEELEKKVRDVAILEQDNAELLEVNQDLLEELEKRDKAVDEAVVMICDLEEKVRRLEEELVHTRPSTAQPTTGSPRSPELQTSSEGRYEVRTSTPSRMHEDESLRRSTISPDVSARLTRLALSQPSDRRVKRLPSFLSNEEPSTDALRSLFIAGGKSIRPVLSSGTLSTRRYEDDMNVDEGLDSPKLSVLSESDLRSMYELQRSTSASDGPSPDIARDVSDTMGSPRSEAVARKRRLARTNRWVAARAVSPLDLDRDARDLPSSASHYQSLGDVLHQEHASNWLAVHPQSKRNSAEKTTPPADAHVIFGRNVLPPTPDTMLSRPSNQSTSSVVNDKNLTTDETAAVKDGSSVAPKIQPAQYTHSHLKPRSKASPGTIKSSAEQGFYNSRLSAQYAEENFGALLFRGSNTEGSTDNWIRRGHHLKHRPLGGSTMTVDESIHNIHSIGVDCSSSPSSSRVSASHQQTRQHYTLNPKPATLLEQPCHNHIISYEQSLQRGNGISSSHMKSSPVRAGESPRLNDVSTSFASPHHSITSQHPKRDNLHTPTEYTADLNTAPPNGNQTDIYPTPPRRAASLRARITRLARRNSGSTCTSASDPKPLTSRKRNASMTKRIFRRSSSNNSDAAHIPLRRHQSDTSTPRTEENKNPRLIRPPSAADPMTMSDVNPATSPGVMPSTNVRSSSLAHSQTPRKRPDSWVGGSEPRDVYSSMSMSSSLATSVKAFTPSISCSDKMKDPTVTVHRMPMTDSGKSPSGRRPSLHGRQSSRCNVESFEAATVGKGGEVGKGGNPGHGEGGSQDAITLGQRIRRSFSRSKEENPR